MPYPNDRPYAPVILITAADGEIAAMRDDRVRVQFQQLPGDAPHQGHVTGGRYRRTDGVLGHWAAVDTEAHSPREGEFEFVMEEVGESPGLRDIYISILDDGVYGWRPDFGFAWPSAAHAPVAIVTIDCGPGYDGSNATDPCPITNVEDARLPLA